MGRRYIFIHFSDSYILNVKDSNGLFVCLKARMKVCKLIWIVKQSYLADVSFAAIVARGLVVSCCLEVVLLAPV